jgi:hypothetical protein
MRPQFNGLSRPGQRSLAWWPAGIAAIAGGSASAIADFAKASTRSITCLGLRPALAGEPLPLRSLQLTLMSALPLEPDIDGRASALCQQQTSSGGELRDVILKWSQIQGPIPPPAVGVEITAVCVPARQPWLRQCGLPAPPSNFHHGQTVRTQ